ncbi:MAG: hypothetical protein ICV65_13485 [Flavisolibacter sp.]|nr:hypothetical protein [Flavisolibacter sp.]
MVQYKELYNGLGLEEMIAKVVNSTWKAPRKKGMENLIQLQNEQVLLTYLLASSVDEGSSYVTRAIVKKALDDLKLFIERNVKTASDAEYAGHLALALERMKAPEKAKPAVHKEMPPGAPIGCYED